MENGATANCRINEPRINMARAIRMRSRFIGKAYTKDDGALIYVKTGHLPIM